jgi:hypothetical protein
VSAQKGIPEANLYCEFFVDVPELEDIGIPGSHEISSLLLPLKY